MDRNIIIGSLWRHYKGNDYLIENLAKNESDKKLLVIYRKLGEEEVWARPKDEFLDIISSGEGTNFHRFERIV